MSDPALRHVACSDPGGQHRMAWWQWGDGRAPHVVVCVHGLTRQGRDFDVLAQALQARAQRQGQAVRVVCPDVVGRGESDWLREPMAYQYPTYLADMLTLLSALQAQAPIGALDWVGTSMGGLIGLLVAGTPSLPLPVPLGRLLLNDVGPTLQWAALERIRQGIGQPVHFANEAEGAAYLRVQSPGFGPFTEAAWLALSRPMLRALPSGGWRLHYDPALAVAMAALTPQAVADGEAILWQLYDQVRAQTLLLRGAQSDLLTPETARAMMRRGPQPRMVEFAGIGHAPMLVADDQVRTVLDFLLPEGGA